MFGFIQDFLVQLHVLFENGTQVGATNFAPTRNIPFFLFASSQLANMYRPTCD